MEKKSPAIGGIGLFAFVFFLIAFLCANSVDYSGAWFLGGLAIAGLCVMIYALITGRTKFLG